MKFKGVAFDFDGVILDSEVAVRDSWKIIAKEKGIPNIDIYCQNSLGLDYDNAKKLFDSLYNGKFSYEENRIYRRKLFFERFYAGKIPLKKNVRETLEYLKEHGIKTALATSTSSESIRKEVEFLNIKQYFDEIICGDMVTKGKPDPEIFQTAVDRLGLEPHEVIGVEDSYNGIRAVKAAGLYTVMVPDLLMPDSEIEKLTDAIYENVGEITKLFSAPKE